MWKTLSFCLLILFSSYSYSTEPISKIEITYEEQTTGEYRSFLKFEDGRKIEINQGELSRAISQRLTILKTELAQTSSKPSKLKKIVLFLPNFITTWVLKEVQLNTRYGLLYFLLAHGAHYFVVVAPMTLITFGVYPFVGNAFIHYYQHIWGYITSQINKTATRLTRGEIKNYQRNISGMLQSNPKELFNDWEKLQTPHEGKLGHLVDKIKNKLLKTFPTALAAESPRAKILYQEANANLKTSMPSYFKAPTNLDEYFEQKEALISYYEFIKNQVLKNPYRWFAAHESEVLGVLGKKLDQYFEHSWQALVQNKPAPERQLNALIKSLDFWPNYLINKDLACTNALSQRP